MIILSHRYTAMFKRRSLRYDTRLLAVFTEYLVYRQKAYRFSILRNVINANTTPLMTLQ